MIAYLCPKPCSHHFLSNHIGYHMSGEITDEVFEKSKKALRNTHYMLLNEEDFLKYYSFVIENNKILFKLGE